MPRSGAPTMQLPQHADAGWRYSMLVQDIAEGLTTPCNQGCTCGMLTHALYGDKWASVTPSSQCRSKFSRLLPAVAAALSSSGHDHCARIATLDKYNSLVVAPLCAELSSQDPAVAAAARSEAVAAALAASRSGLREQLLFTAQDLLERLDTLHVELDSNDESGFQRWAAAAHTDRLPELWLHEIQLACCWVTALVRIWPGSILATPAGTGAAAAVTLLLCAKYIECVSHLHNGNQVVANHYQQQGQQQLQPKLRQLPAADVTAAVLHTASLLLADLRTHVDNNTRPDAVAKLLEQPQALQQTALVVATLFGSQLQLKVLHKLQQQDHQPAQHSSSNGGSNGSSSSNSSGGSSCGAGPRVAAARAEGVLLCRVQHSMRPQVPQVPVVRSWLQYFEDSWGEVLPPPQLLHIAAAIAATEGASAPQQHSGSGSEVQEGQPYQLLMPADCLALAPTIAATAATTSRSSTSSSPGCLADAVCIDFVQAASTVLGLGEVQDPACQRFFVAYGIERAPLLLLASATAALWLKGQDAMPAALACGFTAGTLADALWCEGSEGQPCTMCAQLLKPHAWPTVGLLSLLLQQVMASADIVQHVIQVVTGSSDGSSSSGSSSSGSSGGGSGSRGRRASGGSSSAGGGSRGIHCSSAAGTAVVGSSASGCSSAGGCNSSNTGSSAYMGGSSATHAAHIANVMKLAATLQQFLDLAGSVLQVSLGRALERASPTPLRPQQLQQVSWVTQLLEAAVRGHSRLQLLLSQHSKVAGTDGGAAAAAFGREPMLTAALFVCNNAVANVAHENRSDVAVEVQQVLQAVMSLHLTTLSTAQGQPGAALPAVLLQCAKMQHASVEHATAAAAAGTAAPLSAAVAAGWFLLGRCLLQVAEQLELCLSQPDSYPLSGWLLTSEQAWKSTSSTAEAKRKDMHEAFNQLGAGVELTALAVRAWWEFLMQQSASPQCYCCSTRNSSSCSSSSCSSSSSNIESQGLPRYRLNLMTVCARLEHCLHAHVVTFTHGEPQVLASVLEPSPAHQQQLLQQEGPAWQALMSLKAISSALQCAGGDLLAAAPNRYFCNNPGCRNAGGVSAGFALVRGAACVCGGCVGSQGAAGAAAAPQEAVAARYCSVACQRQHWPEHMMQCPSKRPTPELLAQRMHERMPLLNQLLNRR